MKLAFYTDPLETFNLKKDSTYAMMMEAKSADMPFTFFTGTIWPCTTMR